MLLFRNLRSWRRVGMLHLPTRIGGHSLRPLPTLRMFFDSGLFDQIFLQKEAMYAA